MNWENGNIFSIRRISRIINLAFKHKIREVVGSAVRSVCECIEK